jgi:hypothetical protein
MRDEHLGGLQLALQLLEGSQDPELQQQLLGGLKRLTWPGARDRGLSWRAGLLLPCYSWVALDAAVLDHLLCPLSPAPPHPTHTPIEAGGR